MPLPKLPKLPKGSPFANINRWLYEEDKTVILNPIDKSSTTTKEKTINVSNLEEILTKTHAPNGEINRIIDEVNDLIERVTQNELDIVEIFQRLDIVEQTMSTVGHAHAVTPTGAILPSTGRKGGSVRKMQGGGEFTQPVPTSMGEWKQKLIAEIKTLQNTNTSRKGGKLQKGRKIKSRTQPKPTSMEQWKQKLIAEIKTLQNTDG
jgi:hypothetical protein